MFSRQNVPDIVHYLTDNGRRTPEDQLSSYRESVLGGLIEALSETYPVCKRLVGERYFTTKATEFVYQYRSVSPDLNVYGAELGEFIDAFPPTKQLRYLGDVARLEWAWQSVTDSALPSPGNLHALAGIGTADLETLSFRLYDNSILMASPYPVDRIWQVNRNDTVDEAIDLEEGSVNLLVWSDGADNRIERLDDVEWLFLNMIKMKATFGAVCADVKLRVQEADLGILLGEAIQRGWIHCFELS